jgi:RHS repeat-associated protein
MTDPQTLTRNSTTYYYHNDHLGTPQSLTDQNGQIVWQAERDAFGNSQENTQSITNNLGFAGQYLDRESGLYYNWHRYYDTGAGRYIETDPIGLAGGINTYAYVFSNPLLLIDVFGLEACWFTPMNQPIYTPTNKIDDKLVRSVVKMWGFPVPDWIGSAPDLNSPRAIPMPGFVIKYVLKRQNTYDRYRLNKGMVGGVWRCPLECGRVQELWGNSPLPDKWMYETTFTEVEDVSQGKSVGTPLDPFSLPDGKSGGGKPPGGLVPPPPVFVPV